MAIKNIVLMLDLTNKNDNNIQSYLVIKNERFEEKREKKNENK